MLKMGKETSLSTEKQAQIVTLKQFKLFCTSNREEGERLVNKTAVHNSIMNYQNDTFKNRKRSGRPRVSSYCREDRVMHKVVIRSPMSSSKKNQAKLMERGTVVSDKTIQRGLSLDFGIKSCKPARKPRLPQAMKIKCLDFAKRHASWYIEMWKKVLFRYNSGGFFSQMRQLIACRNAGEQYADF